MYKTKKCDTLEMDTWFLFLNNLNASHTSHNFHRKGKDDRENMDVSSPTAGAWRVVRISSYNGQEVARQQDALCLG